MMMMRVMMMIMTVITLWIIYRYYDSAVLYITCSICIVVPHHLQFFYSLPIVQHLDRRQRRRGVAATICK